MQNKLTRHAGLHNDDAGLMLEEESSRLYCEGLITMATMMESVNSGDNEIVEADVHVADAETDVDFDMEW